MKKFAMVLGAVSGLALATAAHAAPVITFDGVSGTFGNAEVNTSVFDDIIDVTFDAAGLVNFTITTGFAGNAFEQDIDFTSVTFDGVEFFANDVTEPSELRTLENYFVSAPGTYQLRIQGVAGNGTIADASYSGTINFAANAVVPEPATWAMMLAGFGAVGHAMRRRPARRTQAV